MVGGGGVGIVGVTLPPQKQSLQDPSIGHLCSNQSCRNLKQGHARYRNIYIFLNQPTTIETGSCCIKVNYEEGKEKS